MYYSWHAGIAQLVEHNLAKVGVASSSLVSRSSRNKETALEAVFLCPGFGRRVALRPAHACGDSRQGCEMRLLIGSGRAVLKLS